MRKTLLLTLLLCLLSTSCWANVIIPVFILFPLVVQSTFFGISWRAIFRLFDYCGTIYCPDALTKPAKLIICPSGYQTIKCGFNNYMPIVMFGLAGIILLWIVVQIEYLYLTNALPDLDNKTIKKQVWKANIFSTAIGFLFWIPLAFYPYGLTGYLFAGPIIFTKILDGDDTLGAFIIVILCLLPILYVCFKLSHWTEAPFLRKIRGDYTEEQINKAVKKANRHSYWWVVLATILAPISTAGVFLYVLIKIFRKKQKKIKSTKEQIQNT